MPVQRCTANGQSGWRWGSAGKCYTGEGARERAARQGRAIEAAKHRRMGRVGTEVIAFLVGGVLALAVTYLTLHLMQVTVLSGCELVGMAEEQSTGAQFEGYLCSEGLRLLIPTVTRPPKYGV